MGLSPSRLQGRAEGLVVSYCVLGCQKKRSRRDKEDGKEMCRPRGDGAEQACCMDGTVEGRVRLTFVLTLLKLILEQSQVSK